MARVEAKRFVPHLIILAAVLATYGFLAMPRTLRGNPDGPIPLTLPERLGPYVGEDLFFCQDDQCGGAFRTRELKAAPEAGGVPLCPSCTNEVASVSIGERKALPKDTPIFRKIYAAPNQPDVQCTIVFSGSERMSIHRPQVCLVSQGNRIVNEYDYEVKIAPDRRMPIRVIEIVQQYTNAQGKRIVENAAYAYWFFNPERETPSHVSRLLRMAYDNAFRNYRPRWAYVSIALLMDPVRPDSFRETLDDFVPRLYPVTEALRGEFRRMEGETEASPR